MNWLFFFGWGGLGRLLGATVFTAVTILPGEKTVILTLSEGTDGTEQEISQGYGLSQDETGVLGWYVEQGL
ncbi:hypothetical protein [Photobacterium gaetbulicola]|uniref:hypothetical protein n=1 Tax=Photobacterium gaetbulicola TaxID=1295392 RepID=UPI0011B1DAD8|nr:hypothetical protein [Photobacterium gaetbulicola]